MGEPSHRLTADKREIRNFPKLPSATSFIRKTLSEMAFQHLNTIGERWKDERREN